MGQNELGTKQIGTQNLVSLFADDAIEAVSLPVLMKSGATYKRGELLALDSSDSKYKKFDADGANNLDLITGILVEDVDATDADVKSSAYVTGIFNKDAIVTEETFAVGVYTNNCFIIIKELVD